MKTAGMIGGLGPESTIDYYKLMIARYRARKGDSEYPEILVNSLNVAKGIRLVESGRLEELAEYLLAGVEALARAGAGFGFFSANTPHIVFDEVARRSPIPLLSIVRAAREHAASVGLQRVGLLGTGFTMKATFYPDEFRKSSIAVVTPNAEEREFVHQKYLGELLVGTFLPETREGILRVARRMAAEDGAEAILLAGTELPLLLRHAGGDMKFLDTTEIHVDAVVGEMLSA